MKIIIIGAGIGGLTAAIALQRQGHEAIVYEAAPELKPIGAGLWVAPNGQEVLRRLDPELLEAVCAAGFSTDGASIMTTDGQVLSRVEAAAFRVPIARTLAIRRSELHRLLHAALQPGSVLLDHRLEAYELGSEGVRARFANGAEAQGDLLIGADGIHSLVRRQLFGEIPLRYSGQTCWRGLSPIRLSGEWANKAAEIWGDAPGLRAGFSHIAADLAYFYITALSEPGRHEGPEQEKARLLQMLRGFPQVVSEMVEAIPVADLIRSDLYDLPPLKQYCRGRVALLGDAAHATTPNLGQGANQAMESGLAMGNCLAGVQPDGLAAALQTYEQRRIPKATSIVKTSWQFNQLINLRSPLARKVRNFAIRHLPQQMTLRQFEKIYTVSV
ncbi:MAG TPA: FAD-dependent monooxygenase [Candidatus Obscuribacterales bacterium]